MLSLRYFQNLLLSLVLGLLAGCATPGSTLSRIDASRAEYETWPVEVKQAVLDGRIEKGMTTRQVEVAIGKPDKVESRETQRGTQEVWIYNRRTGGLLGGSVVSVGTGGVGVATRSGAGSTESFRVEFENGQVVRSEGPQEE